MSGKSFKMRSEHKAPVIGESLYLWAGNQVDLPKVHDSLQKRELTSTVDIYQLSTADWSSHLTRGTPPLGVIGYSCTTSHSNIYYFGGWCGHDDCYYNTLNLLNTIKMQWTSCSTAKQSLMKKAGAGMISLEFDGAEYLVIIGGRGSTPTVYHPQFQYDQLKNGRVRTNEQLLYNVSTGQFTVLSVSGQCCPPTNDFIIEKITTTGNRGIMFGGMVTVNGDESTSTNSVYIFSVTHSIINWEILKLGAIPNEGLWPMERCTHASAIINGDSTSPTLVVIGGRDKTDQLVNECLLFDSITTGQYSCRKIPLPESVTGRYDHSLTAVTMSPHCVWLVIVGGCKELEWKDVGRGKKKPMVTFITDTNRLIMIIELVYSEAGEWIVQSVLDGNDLTSKNYQEKYQSYSKTRTWWMDQLINHPTEKEMKLQRYIQSLHQDLQVAHQSKVSLQEALVEANKQVKGDDSNDIMSSKLAEMRQEQKKLNQIITDLRAKVSDNDLHIAKLVKERQETVPKQERVLHQSIKETSSIGLQFNYLIPSMDKLDCLSDVQVAERKLFLIQGDKPQLMNWEKYGLRIGVQEESLLPSETVEAAVVALVGGQFVFPKNTVLVSAVYAVSVSKSLLKPLRLEIEHCIDLKGQQGLTRFLKFAIAPVSTPSLPYQFSIVEGGEFSSNSEYGSIERTKFCLVCIVGLIMVTIGGGPTGGGGAGQQQQQLVQHQVAGGQDQQQAAGGQDQLQQAAVEQDQQQAAGGHDQQQAAGGQDQQQAAGGQDQQQQAAGGQDQQQAAGRQDQQQQAAGGQEQQQAAGGQDQQQQAAGEQDQQQAAGGHDQQQAAGGQDQQQAAGGQDQQQQAAGGQDQQQAARGQDQQQQAAGGQDQQQAAGGQDQQQAAGGQDQQQAAGGQDQQQEVTGGQDQQQQAARGQEQQQQVAGGQDQQQQAAGGQDQQQAAGGQDQQQQAAGGQDQQQAAGGQDQQQAAGGQDQQQAAGGQDQQQEVTGGQDQQQQAARGQEQQQQVAGGQDQQQQAAGGQDQQQAAGGQDQQQQVAGGQGLQQQAAGAQDQQQQAAGAQDQQQAAGGQDQQQQAAGGQDQQQQAAGGQDQQQQAAVGQDQQQQAAGGQDQQQQAAAGQDQRPEEATLELDTASSSTSKAEVPTGVLGASAYAGLFFYNDNENQVTFTAAKDLNALLEYIKKDYPHARRGQNIYFRFQSDDGYIKLIFNAPQEKPFTDGWTVMPHLKPCRLHRFDINGFGEANYPLPPSCLISVYASPGAVPTLHYSVPLDGVADPKTLFITRALKTTPPSTNHHPTTSSSNVVHESTSVPEASTFRSDLAYTVMTECTGMIKERLDLNTLVDKLLEKRMINEREKTKVLDERRGLTANQRMDELLSLVKASIREDGEDFGLFLEIIKQENTRRADRLAQTLLDNYKRLL